MRRLYSVEMRSVCGEIETPIMCMTTDKMKSVVTLESIYTEPVV